MTDDSRNDTQKNDGGNGSSAREPFQFTLRTLFLVTLVVALFCSAAATFEGMARFLAVAAIAWAVVGAIYWKMRAAPAVVFAHICGPVYAADPGVGGLGGPRSRVDWGVELAGYLRSDSRRRSARQQRGQHGHRVVAAAGTLSRDSRGATPRGRDAKHIPRAVGPRLLDNLDRSARPRVLAAWTRRLNEALIIHHSPVTPRRSP